MARNPISRAITNAASEMRHRAKGYFYDIPKNYLQLIDRAAIAAKYKAGVPLATAAKEEIAKVSKFVLPKAPNRPMKVYDGKEGYDAVKKIERWNRQVRLLEQQFAARGEKMPTGTVYKTKYENIQNLEAVTKMVSETTPAYRLHEMDMQARANLEQSLLNSMIPIDVVNAIMDKINKDYKGIGKFNDLLNSNKMLTIEIYGSDMQTGKTNIDEFMRAIGLNPDDFASLSRYTAVQTYD